MPQLQIIEALIKNYRNNADKAKRAYDAQVHYEAQMDRNTPKVTVRVGGFEGWELSHEEVGIIVQALYALHAARRDEALLELKKLGIVL